MCTYQPDPFIIGVTLSNVTVLFWGNRRKGKGKVKESVGKGKRKVKELVGKGKSWFLGNGERLIKMTTFKKTRTPL